MPLSAPLKTREFDVANYIETPADVAAYLKLAVAEGEGPGELARTLGDILRSKGGQRLSLGAFVGLLHEVGLEIRAKCHVGARAEFLRRNAGCGPLEGGVAKGVRLGLRPCDLEVCAAFRQVRDPVYFCSERPGGDSFRNLPREVHTLRTPAVGVAI